MNIDEDLNKFTLEELKTLSKIAKSVSDIKELKKYLNKTIKAKRTLKAKSLNSRYQLSLITTFTPEERKILLINNIQTLEELRNSNLSSLIGITNSIKESLEWAREFYNLDNIELPIKQKRISRKTDTKN